MRQKCGQGLPRIQIAPPLFGIFRRQQNLCRRQTLFGQRRLPALRQLNLSPMLDLETLPDQLAGLYIKRYEMTFPDDEADSTNPHPLDQFDSHTRPMLAMLMAARSAVPESALERVKPPSGGATTRWKNRRRRHLDFVKQMCDGSLVRNG